MSVKPHVYLGPYVEVCTRRISSMRNTCPQPTSCPKPETGFCAVCGKPAQQRMSLITTPEPDIQKHLRWPLLDILVVQGEPEVQGDLTLFRLVPNKDRGAPRRFEWSTYDGEGRTTLVSSTMIHDEMRWFQRAFKLELERLELIQFPRFEICWGQIIYWE